MNLKADNKSRVIHFCKYISIFKPQDHFALQHIFLIKDLKIELSIIVIKDAFRHIFIYIVFGHVSLITWYTSKIFR